jgi:hypothetical protein
MRHKLLFIICFLLMLSAQAQTDSYSYAQLLDAGTVLRRQFIIKLEIPPKTQGLSDQDIKDLSQRVSYSKSLPHAMNLMSEEGWEFVQAYTVSRNDITTVFWVIRRRNQDSVGL